MDPHTVLPGEAVTEVVLMPKVEKLLEWNVLAERY